MQIHCVATVVVVLAGIWLGLSRTEWCICLILFGLILGLELVNTAVEAVVDLASEDYHPLAKKAKDTAAGAVLIAAIAAAVIGVIIFTIISYGLAFIGVNANWQLIIKGLIICIAVALDMRKNA